MAKSNLNKNLEILDELQGITDGTYYGAKGFPNPNKSSLVRYLKSLLPIPRGTMYWEFRFEDRNRVYIASMILTVLNTLALVGVIWFLN